MWYLIVSISDLCTLTYFVDCLAHGPVYLSDAKEALPGCLVIRGKGAFISWEQMEKINFEGNKDNIREQGT